MCKLTPHHTGRREHYLRALSAIGEAPTLGRMMGHLRVLQRPKLTGSFQETAKVFSVAETGRVAAEARWPGEGQLSRRSRPQPAGPQPTFLRPLG